MKLLLANLEGARGFNHQQSSGVSVRIACLVLHMKEGRVEYNVSFVDTGQCWTLVCKGVLLSCRGLKPAGSFRRPDVASGLWSLRLSGESRNEASELKGEFVQSIILNLHFVITLSVCTPQHSVGWLSSLACVSFWCLECFRSLRCTS